MEFIVHFKDGGRETYNTTSDDYDAAWDDVNMTFPDAEYIELF